MCAAMAVAPLALTQTQPSPGVNPLPQGPPDTKLQAPVPAPAQAIPPADQPLNASPNISAIKGFAESHPITIQEAVAIALYTNRSLAIALANLQRAHGRTGEARAALNPSLSLNSQLNYFDAPTTVSFSAFAPPGTPPASITLVPQFNPINTATFALPLDITGTLHSEVSQAEFNELATRIDIARTKNQVVADVKNAFYNTLRSQAQLAVATDNVNQALTRLSDALINYAAGTVPYFDVLSSQRDVSDAQQGLIAAKAQVSDALAALKNTMGIDIGTHLAIASQGAVEYPPGVPPPSAPAPQPQTEEPRVAPNAKFTPLPAPRTDVVQEPIDFGPDYQALLAEGLKDRPEIAEAEAQVTAAQRGMLFARRSSLPSLSLSLNYVNTPRATGFTRKNQGVATLGISVPVFDAGLASARVEEARADVATAQINRRQTSDAVRVDIQQAYVALLQARDRVAAANVELVQAQEAYRLARTRYNAGTSTQVTTSPELELSSAQTSLTQAQSNQVNALYDYNNAKAQLDRALGRYR